MSIVNEFSAKVIRYSMAENTVYVIDEHDHRSTFNFNIYCKRSNISTTHFFFNTNTHQCFICVSHGGPYHCVLLRFWLQDDLPVLSARVYENQDVIMDAIKDQWNQQYGAMILDGIINAD